MLCVVCCACESVEGSGDGDTVEQITRGAEIKREELDRSHDREEECRPKAKAKAKVKTDSNAASTE